MNISGIISLAEVYDSGSVPVVTKYLNGHSYYERKQEENTGNIIIKKIYDKTEKVNVEDQIKIKCDGYDSRGRSVKLSCCSINMYHTMSSLLVNGEKLINFMDSDLPENMKNYTVGGKPTSFDNLNKYLHDMISKSMSELRNANDDAGCTEKNHTSGEQLQLAYSTNKIENSDDTNSDSQSVLIVNNEENGDAHHQDSVSNTDNNMSMIDRLLIEQLVEKTDKIFEKLEMIAKIQERDKIETESKISQINDKLVSLSKQISTNDKHQTENLQDLKSDFQNLHSEQDKRFNTTQNRVQGVSDKLKEISTQLTRINTNNNPMNINVEGVEKVKLNTESQTTVKQPQTSNLSCRKTENETTQNAKTRKSSHLTSDPAVHQTPNRRSTSNFKQSKTLIMGSSIVKGIDKRRLDAAAEVRTHRGATVSTLTDKVTQMDISKYNTIILVVGGNDASTKTHPEDFHDAYVNLIQTVRSSNAEADIVISEILPRRNVNTELYNDILSNICDELNCQLVKQFDSFVSKNRELPPGWYPFEQY